MGVAELRNSLCLEFEVSNLNAIDRGLSRGRRCAPIDTRQECEDQRVSLAQLKHCTMSSLHQLNDLNGECSNTYLHINTLIGALNISIRSTSCSSNDATVNPQSVVIPATMRSVPGPLRS